MGWLLKQVEALNYFSQRPEIRVDYSAELSELSIYFIDRAQKRIFTIKFQKGCLSSLAPPGDINLWATDIAWKYGGASSSKEGEGEGDDEGWPQARKRTPNTSSPAVWQ